MLRSAFINFRNRLLADPKFLAFAQRSIFTRPLARARSKSLFNILAGFSYSQVLYACVRLKVLELVGVAGCSRAELAAATGLTSGKLELLVKAAAALGLLDHKDERLLLGPHGAALLAQPWIMQFVEHHRHFYRDMADPVALLRGDNPGSELKKYWSYSDAGASKDEYSLLMSESQRAVSQQILNAYDFGHHKKLLDVGGGSGTFLRAVGVRHTALELHLFDLPGVVQLVVNGPGSPVITTYAGNFHEDQLPAGADVVTLVRVVHDHDDESVLVLLRNIRQSCSPGTVLLIAEPLAGTKSTAVVTDAYFNFYFAAMGQGRTRTPQELSSLAERAGFVGGRVRPTAMPLIAGVMTFIAGTKL